MNEEFAAGLALPFFAEDHDNRDLFFDRFPGPIDGSHLDMLHHMMT